MRIPGHASTYFFLAALFISVPFFIKIGYTGHTGKFLMATDRVQGEIFENSLIYIHENSIFGAFGFILNQTDAQNEALHIGGPVSPDRLFILHAMFPDNLHLVRDEMSFDDLDKMMERYNKQPYIRFYKGYTGWGFLQLEREIHRGSWRVIDAPKGGIFDAEGQRQIISQN